MVREHGEVPAKRSQKRKKVSKSETAGTSEDESESETEDEKFRSPKRAGGQGKTAEEVKAGESIARTRQKR